MPLTDQNITMVAGQDLYTGSLTPPAELTFAMDDAALVGTPAAASIVNSSVTASGPWSIPSVAGLSFTPNSGPSIAAGATQNIVVTATTAGSRSVELRCAGAIISGSPQVVVVTNPAILAITFSADDTGRVNTAAAGLLQNTGNTALPWSITPPSGISVSPSSGTLAAGASQALAITPSAIGTYSLALVAAGATITGSPQSIVAGPALATALTVSFSSAGVTGVPVTVTVTPNGPIGTAGTSTLAVSNSGVLGATLFNWTVGQTSSQSTTLSRAADGVSVLTQTNSMGLTNTGSGATYTSSAAVAPTGSITQYLTSDGGDAAYSGLNFSGPTNLKWHNRLNFYWARTNPLGNWLDAGQTQEGSTPFASFGAATTVNQTISATVTTLVQRWMSNGANRGFYLSGSATAWPTDYYGRGDATTTNRPKLVVVTTTGTFTLTAAANAWWSSSSSSGNPSKDWFRVTESQSPAILRFDLSTVTGTVTSATLSIVVKAFDTGHTGQVVQVFEADPPTIIVPEGVSSPVTGIANGYSDFNAFKTGGNAALIAADDFEAGGPFDVAGAFEPTETKVFNAATGTTYARGTIASGGSPSSGTGSADVRLDVSRGTGTLGAPDVVRPELYGQYSIYFESDFGTTQDDAIKIPAMGVQFGWWNSASGGYWQQTTGNGGSPGTGLKVAGTGATNGNYEYQGHSARLVTGTRPKAGDDDPYDGWFGVELYCYHLDQVGPFPGGRVFPMVAIRVGQWYTFDIRVRQNSMTGSQDGLGNYATAVSDGIYQVWINGYQVFSKTDYRWRRHAEFGVQGVWIDVFHGGNTPALVDMHYRVDRVSVATSYIGPKAATLPSYVPAAGELATLTVANGKLTNQWRDVIDAYYEPFYSVKSVNAYSGAFKNPYWGTYGCTVFFGGGHAGGNYNGVIVAEYGATAITYKRACNATPWFGSGTDSTTQLNNGSGLGTNAVTDLNYMESTIDGKPGAPHSYGCGDIVGPEYGGADNGTFLRVLTAAVNRANDAGAVAAHRLPFTSTSGSGGAGNWERVTNEYRTDLTSWAAPQLTAFVGPQQRVYIQTNNSTANVRWFDRNLSTWVNGSGATFGYDGADGFDSGALFYVPSRGLLLCLYPVAGSLRIQWMDVTVTQPTLGGTATLSTPIAVSDPWSAATWCPDNDRIIVGKEGLTGVYEVTIPSTLSSTWTVDYAAFTTGGTFPLETTGEGGNTYKKFAYDERIKSIVYQRTAAASGDDTVYVYRPRGT